MKGVLGVFGVFWAITWPELDQHRVGVLLVVEKAKGAGGSPGGVVQTSADGREYKYNRNDGRGHVGASG